MVRSLLLCALVSSLLAVQRHRRRWIISAAGSIRLTGLACLPLTPSPPAMVRRWFTERIAVIQSGLCWRCMGLPGLEPLCILLRLP